MKRHSHDSSRSVSTVLDAAERSGRLNLCTTEISAALPEVSPQALRQALYRQQRQGRIIRLSRGANHWLIVPLQYREAGAPPLETWLDHYLAKTLRLPYYVALLSAAETYGASPYAVMVTQVMAPTRRRPITVGRHRIVFHTCSSIERMPTRWHETPEGRFKVSTPELTALQLVQHRSRSGGIARVRDVLTRLWGGCSKSGMHEALEALRETSTAQRLGALLALDGQEILAQQVEHWLQDKRLRIVPLEAGQAPAETNSDPVFKVRIPPHLHSSNL